MNSKIYDFFFNFKTDYSFLPFFRIGVSIILILIAVNLRNEYLYLLSSDGLINIDLKNIEASDYCPTVFDIFNFLNPLLSVNERQFIKIFCMIYFVSLISLLIGFLSKISSIIIFVLHLILMKSLVWMVYGMDYIHHILLFYSIFFPLGNSYSIDSLIFKNKVISSFKLSFFRRVLQIHLCIIYFFGGFGKSFGFNWWNGHSIWKSINRPDANIDFINHFASMPSLLIFLGIYTILIEMFYPIFIYNRYTKLTCFLSIIFMHIFIGFFLQLYFFSATMILFNFIAFFNFENSKSKWEIVNT
ncbi:MAG: hypothetical protein MUF43_12385 [Flavobacterium sp.]|jgi:hypothetical protein|nr:hypothetical protein [Flavobacterium sp.]